jgi:hypothetical protein
MVEKARGETRGSPRTFEFDPKIGGTPLAIEVAAYKNRVTKPLDGPQDCGREPKGRRACTEKNRLARENVENGEPRARIPGGVGPSGESSGG